MPRRRPRRKCAICLEFVYKKDLCTPCPCPSRRHHQHQACMDKWRTIHPGAQCVECCGVPGPAAAPIPPLPPRNSDNLLEVAPGVLVFPCPNCGVYIEKTGGCPRVTCRICRNTFQYPVTRAEDMFVAVMAITVTIAAVLALFIVFPMCVYGIRAYVYHPALRPSYVAVYETTYGEVPVDVVTTKANLQMQIDALEKQKRLLVNLYPSFTDDYDTCLVTMAWILCAGGLAVSIISLIPLRYLPGSIGRFVLEMARVFND